MFFPTRKHSALVSILRRRAGGTAALIALVITLTNGQPTVASAQQLNIGINPINFHVYVWRKTNEYRATHAQPSIPATPHRLHQAAQKYAEYLARNNATGHTADGRTAGQRLAAEGYNACFWSENVYEQWNMPSLASWQNAADGAMQSWRNSPAHAANMRDPRAKQLGVGVAAWNHGGRHYYKVVQVFGDDCTPPSPRRLRKLSS